MTSGVARQPSSVWTMTTFLSFTARRARRRRGSRSSATRAARRAERRAMPPCGSSWPKQVRPDTQWSADDEAAVSSSFVKDAAATVRERERAPRVPVGCRRRASRCWSCGAHASEQSSHGSYVVFSTTGRVSGFGSLFWLSFPFSLNDPTTFASVEIDVRSSSRSGRRARAATRRLPGGEVADVAGDGVRRARDRGAAQTSRRWR